MKILEFIWLYRWELIAVAIVVVYGKRLYHIFIFDPIAGGNGKVQMDEIAKVFCMYLLWKAERAEGISAEQVYPDVFWISTLGALAIIAGLKHYYGKKTYHDGGSASSSTSS